MGKTVCHPICGIAAGVDRKGALQLVVAGSMQKIADRNHPGHSAPEENQLAWRPALAERFCHRIQFSSAITQVVVRDTKIQTFQDGMAGKKRFVGGIPETVLSVDFR